MLHTRRQYLFCASLLAYLLCLVSLPVSVCSQDLEPAPPPPSSGNAPGGASQEDEIVCFLAQFNGCAWYRTPNDPYRDVYLELKDGTLILYEYLKDPSYCATTFSNCFTQEELWRMKVTGYDTVLPDRPGNAYRVVMNRNGKTITMHGVDNAGRDYVIGIFVRIFCSENM